MLNEATDKSTAKKVLEDLARSEPSEYRVWGRLPRSRSLACFDDPVDDAELWSLANACAAPKSPVANESPRLSRGIETGAKRSRPSPPMLKPRVAHSRDHGSSRSTPC